MVPDLVRSPEVALALRTQEQRLSALGVAYRAPCDARSTGLPDASVDYVTSTSTLEHIPDADIHLMRGRAGAYSVEGRMSMLIVYQDPYSYANSSICRQLPPLRRAGMGPLEPAAPAAALRLLGYVRGRGAEGLEVVDEETFGGTPDDLERFAELRPALAFRHRVRRTWPPGWRS